MTVATASDRQRRITRQSRWQRENSMRRLIEEKKPKRSTITEGFGDKLHLVWYFLCTLDGNLL